MASTCNEMLLMDHLLRRPPTTAAARLYLLDHHLAQINGTVVRQTMFAEFELAIHALGEAGRDPDRRLAGRATWS